MWQYPLFRRWRLCILGIILICGGSSLVGGTLPTFAAVAGCRADPIVWLSNGTKVTVIASSTASASVVKLITYTVHIPRGVSMTKLVYTGGVLKDKERVVVVADRVGGYQITTVADMGSTRASVTIDATVNTIKQSLIGSSGSPIVFLFS